MAMSLAGTQAFADTLEILGPPGAVPRDGFEVAVVRRDASGHLVPVDGARLGAEGASVRALPEETRFQAFRVEPSAGAGEVVLEAELGVLRAKARYPLGPPATHVELSLEPARPVKGRDAFAQLTVRLRGKEGAPDDSGTPPVIRANVGQVDAPVRVGPGLYRARYTLPPTRYPEVAVLVALSAWPHPQSIHGAYGRMLVPLATSLDLTGRTEPEARMSIEISDVTYGPVRAGKDGRFKIPVVIPPGQRIARGRAVDRAGNARRTPIDLMLPPTDGLACVASPQRLPADGKSKARLLCATSDAFGALVPEAQVTVKAELGVLEGPRRAADGLLEWLYTAPPTLGAERLAASWTYRGAVSKEELPIELMQGPVKDVQWELGEGPVHWGSGSSVRVRTVDALGRPRPGARLELASSEGRIEALREASPTNFEARWTLPAEGEGSTARLTARIWSPRGAEPARLHAWLAEGVVWVGVSDLAGLPVPEQPLRIDGRLERTGQEGVLRLGPARAAPWDVAHAEWPGLRERVHLLGSSGPLFPRGAPLPLPPRTKVVRLAPAVPVNVRVQVRGREVTYWAEDAEGGVLGGRALSVSLSGGDPGETERREGRSRFVVPGEQPVQVSVADLATGVTAVVEVGP